VKIKGVDENIFYDGHTFDGKKKLPCIVFPYEVNDLNDEQLKRYNSDVYHILVGNSRSSL